MAQSDQNFTQDSECQNCRELVHKLKYLIDNPQTISCAIEDIGSYWKSFKRRIFGESDLNKIYSTNCTEFNDFIKEQNRYSSGDKIFATNKYVSRLFPYVINDFNNRHINYYLDK